MSEPLSINASDAPPPSPRAAGGARVAELGERLASLLESFESPEFAGGIGFLRATSAAPEALVLDEARLLRLRRRLDLGALDLDLVLLAAMAGLHEGYASVLQSLHPKREASMSVGLAAQLLCQEPEDRSVLRRALSDGPARRAGLIELRDDGPFFNCSLELGAGVAELLAGTERWPSELVRTASHESPAEVERVGLDGWLASEEVQRAITCLRERDEPPLILLVADELRTASERGRALVAAAGRRLAHLELSDEQAAGRQAAIANQLLARERVGVVTVAAASETRSPTALPCFTEGSPAVVLCTTRERMRVESRAGRRRPLLALECGPLEVEDLRAAWATAAPELREHAPALAARFPLEPSWIREIGEDLRVVASLGQGEPGPGEVLRAVRTRAGTSMRPGVKLRRPAVGWDELVLSEDRLALLREGVARVRQQSRVLDDWGFLANRPGARGVRMLFCGPPGTGKTLSAEVLAAELDTDLLIVDLSRLVSKWIGETEKNLAEVFAAAERSRAVLFFDEADALFAKRTEVSDAHDRYANLETAYLLSRLEQYEGLAVLATNLRRNVDAAFLRRLEFVVEFERPSRGERLALWRAHLPAGAPLAGDVKLHELADFYPLVGGLIRNAAVAAAFLAAESDTEISRALLLRAIRREYEKSGAAFPGEPRRPSS